jgi:hypothetical protein
MTGTVYFSNEQLSRRQQAREILAGIGGMERGIFDQS